MKKLLYTILAACVATATLLSCSDDDSGVVKFNSNLIQPVDSFLDVRDSNVYATVRIGNQIWLAENLRYALPGYSLDGAYTWEEGEIDKTKITPDKDAVKALIISTANDPQYEGWNDTLPSGRVYSLVPQLVAIANRMDNPRRPLTIEEALATLAYLPRFYAVLTKKLEAFAELPEVRAAAGKKSHLAAEEKNEGYVAKYGFLYSHAGALAAVPEGWRLPTDEDWKTLERTLGLSASEADKTNAWRGHGLATLLNAGGGARFNATKAGGDIYTFDGSHNYFQKDKAWYYWTATSHMRTDSVVEAYYRQSSTFNDQVWRGTANVSTRRRPVLFSVRLVKDVK